MTTLVNDIQQRQNCFDLLCAAWSSEYHQLGGKLYCGKGCSGCCSLVVNCTLPEAKLVAAALSPHQTEQLQRKVTLLKNTANKATNLKEWLSSYRQQVGPCPFLDQSGACGIYPIRPLSCRSLLATKEPHWCSTDFATLSSQEKQSFMESLDRSAVAFPTHYAATPQEIGRELEEAALRQMETVYGFALVGSLPWLVWLELEHAISKRLSDGRQAVQDYLEHQGLLNQFLVVIT
jgi:Fe-S-cluster containining protein